MIESQLSSTEGLPARMKLLPAAVEIALGSSELEIAEQHVSELEGLVERYDSDVLSALSFQSTGRVAVARNEPGEAAPLFRKAVDILLASGLPFEAARARVDLGLAFSQIGSEGLGQLEIDAARAEFERLGAQQELDRLAETPIDMTASERRELAATMMFTDIVRSTDLVGVIGDDAWADLIAWHDRTIRALIGEHSGVEVDHAGDGFFVSFDTQERALECATQVQRVLDQHRKDEGFSPRVRIGIHTGHVLRIDEGLVGHQVHVAARIAAACEGDEVLVSLETMDQISGFVLKNERTITIKGMDEPLAVGSLVWRD